jgi:hypothetical protein
MLEGPTVLDTGMELAAELVQPRPQPPRFLRPHPLVPPHRMFLQWSIGRKHNGFGAVVIVGEFIIDSVKAFLQH